MPPTHSEVRLETLLDQRAANDQLHETVIASIDGEPTESQSEQLQRYRDTGKKLETEIAELSEYVERDRVARKTSEEIRRALAAGVSGVEMNGDELIYRDFHAFAFDYFITRTNVAEAVKIARQWGVGEQEVQAARQRLDLVQRSPDNTLSSNVAGLTPPQHIAQIFQVINSSRPLVNAAVNVDLERGTLTYPQVDTSPVVEVQNTEKTEGGTTRLAISMVTKTATTYLGGGDLSWQAINWSTPNALRLWFDFVAADYALKTETDAGTVVSASAFLNNISSPIATTADFATFLAAVGAGYAEVYANSGRIANSIIMAPDRFGYLLGMTSAAFSQFVTVGQSDIGPLRVIVTRGLNAGEIIVGDINGLLVAETPGAPVEMQVVEPSIGGVEVGLIGAFEAAVVDDGAFSLITTAS